MWGVTKREGARVKLRWWEQSGIDWEKAKAKEIERRTSGSSGAEWSGAIADEWA